MVISNYFKTIDLTLLMYGNISKAGLSTYADTIS